MQRAGGEGKHTQHHHPPWTLVPVPNDLIEIIFPQLLATRDQVNAHYIRWTAVNELRAVYIHAKTVSTLWYMMQDELSKCLHHDRSTQKPKNYWRHRTGLCKNIICVMTCICYCGMRLSMVSFRECIVQSTMSPMKILFLDHSSQMSFVRLWKISGIYTLQNGGRWNRSGGKNGE